MNRTNATEEAFIERRIRNYKRWLRFGGLRDGAYWEDAFKTEIEQCLKSTPSVSLGILSGCLWSWSILYGTWGALRAASGSSCAGDYLKASHEAILASVEVTSIHLWRMPGNERMRLAVRFFSAGIHAVLGLSAAVALGLSDLEERFWACCRFLGSSEACLDRDWSGRGFEREFLALYAQTRSGCSPLGRLPEVRGKRAYPLLMNSLERADDWNKAMVDACDYHMRNIVNSRSWDAEFALAPYDLIPIEILACQVLRSRLGFASTGFSPRLLELTPKWGVSDSPSPASHLISAVEGVYATNGLSREAFYGQFVDRSISRMTGTGPHC